MVLRAFRASGRVSLAALAAVAAPIALAGSTLVPGCSSGGSPATATAPEAGDSDSSTCPAFVPPSSFDPTTPTVSFMNDVLPIFELSCGFSSCHGSTASPQAGLYLGTDGAKVYANLVGVASTDLPTMDRIKAGDAANSFLLHRIENDACALPGCAALVCSELMPQGGPPLPQAKVLAVRAWVLQGAVSDVPDAGPVDGGPVLDDASPGAGTDASDASGD